MMKNTACLLLSGILATTSFAEKPEGEGWISLFNGETLKGWAIVNGFATYEVKDGAITGYTAVDSPNTFLTTLEHYGDFELVFEVRVDEGLNSGVQIRSHTKDWGRNRYFGPQVEIESGVGQGGYIYGEGLGTGWLSPEPQSEDPKVNQHDLVKAGQWNSYRIVAEGPRIQTFINDEPVADLENRQIWNNFSEGSIGLQVHGIRSNIGPFTVSWKDIYLREIE